MKTSAHSLEKALQETNALINSTPDMIWAVDTEMRLVSFNDAYRQAIEITTERELKIYDPVLIEEFGPELYNEWKVYYQRALSGEYFKITTHAVIGGADHYGQIAFQPIRNANKIVGVSCFNRDITELVNLEKIIRESKDRLELALEASQIGIFDFLPIENKVIWDARLYEIFELAPNSSIDLNEHFFKVLHPEDRDLVESEYANSLSSNAPDSKTFEYRIKLGSKVKHILAHSRMLRNDAGKVYRMLGTSQDITELREYEQKLKKNEELLRSVVQDQQEMIVRWKPGGFRTFVNEAYGKTFDEDPEKTIGTSFFSAMEKTALKNYKEGIKKLTPEAPTRTYTAPILLHTGDYQWQEWTDRAYFDEHGKPVEYQSVGRDIGKLKEYQLALEKSEQLFRSVIQDQEEMIVRWKAGGIRTFVNQSYLDFYGLTWKEAIGTSFFNLIPQQDVKQLKKALSLLTPSNPTREITLPTILPNGSSGWQRWTDRAFFDAKGNVVEYQSIGRDITESYLDKERIAESERKLALINNNTTDYILLARSDERGILVEEINDAGMKLMKLLGINNPKKDLIGISMDELYRKNMHLSDEETGQRLENLEYVKKHQQKLSNESKIINNNGFRVIENEIIPVVNGNRTTHLLIVGRDITEMMTARQELEENERRFRNIFNQQFQFTALLDLEGRVVLINDLPLQVQGVSKQDYIGKHFWETPGWHANKEWQKKIKSQVLEAKQTNEPVIAEDPFYDETGETRYATASYSLIRDSNGDAENILVQAIDISAEKRIKNEILDREKQLSLIYGSSNDFMLLMRVEKEGYFIESVNDATIRGLENSGYRVDRHQLEGINMLSYFENILHYRPDQIQEHYKKYQQARKSKEVVRYTTESYYNEYLFAIDTTVTPIIESGQVTKMLTVSRDITDLARSKTELQEAYAELEQLKAQVEQENIYLKEEIKQANDFENMVFKSPEFRNVLNKVDQVAKTDATVLITGETGTGKELVARALHNTSKRADKPMIKVNTAAIPKDLIESELFGYEKGAFTGASGAKPGKFELADGGSIFLDEIGDMPIELQVKILRVLQEGEVERLGATLVKKIDVRIITATNKNLEQAVAEGKFREDLLYRINVFPIEIPPLRSRPSDIPILVEHFISKYNAKHSKSIKSIPKKVMDHLRNYTWPGNVRELENTIERALIISMGERLTIPEVMPASAISEDWEHENALEVVQENHIRKVLKSCHWKIEGDDGAAAQLKIKPSTLRDKMKKFNIKRPKR